MKTITYIGDIESGVLVDSATNVEYAIARGREVMLPDELAAKLLEEQPPRFSISPLPITPLPPEQS